MAEFSTTSPTELTFELPYEPIHHAEMGEDGPLGGVTEFGSVSYRFSRNHTSPLLQHLRGKLFDLVPEDESQGLPVLAEGKFREASDSESGLVVFWNYMGCPLLDADPAIHVQFADFLERLAAGTATRAHLPSFFIQHYADQVVEETRRAFAGLLYEFDDTPKAAQESPRREQILAWAASLRGR
ncbi:MAG TPA: hypothetical protein VFS20_22495 [Longimicrobium sp.]|nr:hypothetical protein [Longimicrobium sp.]